MLEKQDLRLFTCVLLKYSNFFKVKWPPWSWSCGSWIYNYLYMQSVPITTNVISNPVQATCTRYNIMW